MPREFNEGVVLWDVVGIMSNDVLLTQVIYPEILPVAAGLLKRFNFHIAIIFPGTEKRFNLFQNISHAQDLEIKDI